MPRCYLCQGAREVCRRGWNRAKRFQLATLQKASFKSTAMLLTLKRGQHKHAKRLELKVGPNYFTTLSIPLAFLLSSKFSCFYCSLSLRVHVLSRWQLLRSHRFGAAYSCSKLRDLGAIAQLLAMIFDGHSNDSLTKLDRLR